MLTLTMLAALYVLASLSMHAKAQESKEGMVVVRDPQTGKMRAPTPEELRELRAKAPPPAGMAGAQQNKPLSRSDGARGVRLGEKTMVYEVVTRGEDGKLSSRCVQGAAAADAALQHPANAVHEEDRHETR
jgi:hypothetical protein